jgi:two-component system NtrC family response regulator
VSNLDRTILIVDDDAGLLKQLKWVFADKYTTTVAVDRSSAIAAVRRHEPAVVTLDLGLPPDPANSSEGLETLQQILELSPYTKVIVVTGNDDKENALRSVGMGAYDFYQKPVDSDVLQMIVERAFRLAELEQEHRQLSETRGAARVQGLVTASPQMLSVCKTVEKIAPANVTTLILGESGTGKELLARAIHDLSPRKSARFVPINCAAIPDTLLESELFGHERGAFTGAVKQTLGRIEYADKGTLFLDEIGDLPLALQAKLLRFLQERVIERIGGRDTIPVDVRVVCATNRDLQQLIGEDKFREDLYYRIGEVSVEVPALRTRSGDALLLARVFLSRFSQEFNKPVKGFSDDALKSIERYTWPGNVRELENCIKRAVIMSDTSIITGQDLALRADFEPFPLNIREVRDSAEKTAVQRALAHTDGNLSRASELLGITRPTLYALRDKHGLGTPRARVSNGS